MILNELNTEHVSSHHASREIDYFALLDLDVLADSRNDVIRSASTASENVVHFSQYFAHLFFHSINHLLQEYDLRIDLRQHRQNAEKTSGTRSSIQTI